MISVEVIRTHSEDIDVICNQKHWITLRMKYHRLRGPAVQKWRGDKKIAEYYQDQNKLHRIPEQGPAYKRWNTSGELEMAWDFIHGTFAGYSKNLQ